MGKLNIPLGSVWWVEQNWTVQNTIFLKGIWHVRNRSKIGYLPSQMRLILKILIPPKKVEHNGIVNILPKYFETNSTPCSTFLPSLFTFITFLFCLFHFQSFM